MATAGVINAAASFVHDSRNAVHEAGHAVIGLHLAQSGVRCDDGHTGTVHGVSPTLLKYATITPRTTEDGRLYAAETKLAVRWRHMCHHFVWSVHKADMQAEPVLQCRELQQELKQAELTPLGRIALCRIVFYMAGRVPPLVSCRESDVMFVPGSRGSSQLISCRCKQHATKGNAHAEASRRGSQRLEDGASGPVGGPRCHSHRSCVQNCSTGGGDGVCRCGSLVAVASGDDASRCNHGQREHRGRRVGAPSSSPGNQCTGPRGSTTVAVCVRLPRRVPPSRRVISAATVTKHSDSSSSSSTSQ